jgi:hypothetical protein
LETVKALLEAGADLNDMERGREQKEKQGGNCRKGRGKEEGRRERRTKLLCCKDGKEGEGGRGKKAEEGLIFPRAPMTSRLFTWLPCNKMLTWSNFSWYGRREERGDVRELKEEAGEKSREER